MDSSNRVDMRARFGSHLRVMAEPLESRTLLSDPTPRLLGDLRQSGASTPSSLALLDGTVLLARNDGIHGNELWKSDGTTAGTVLLKDIVPGPAGSDPYLLARCGNIVYFQLDVVAGNSSHVELWKTDGTSRGTTLVRSNLAATEAVASGGLLYFNGGSSDQSGLWRSDGTVEGTYLLLPQFTRMLTNVAGRLFFASKYIYPFELWTSDGTVEGTRPLTTVDGSSASAQLVQNLTNVNGRLYFSGFNGTVGLYTSDGTPVGTRELKAFPDDFIPSGLTLWKGALYFALAGPDYIALWRSDGTAAGTAEVMQPPTGLGQLTPVGDRLYFDGGDATTGPEVGWTDGTLEGTHVIDALPGTPGLEPESIFALNGRVYFSGLDAKHGRELWQSDGTLAGTYRLSDIDKGPANSYPRDFLVKDGRQIIFNAETRQMGYELWRYDPQSNRPPVQLVKDADVTTDSSAPRQFVKAGPKLYFTAADDHAIRRLWVSDGQSDTHIVPGLPQDPNDYIAFGDALLYSSTQGLHRIEPDGGLSMLLSGPAALFLFRSGDVVYFSSYDYVSNRFGLWKTDGTPGGTVQLAQLYEATGGVLGPLSFTSAGNKVYFISKDPTTGAEPWVTDGTPQGTHLVADINPGPGNGISTFIVFHDTFYFQGNDGVHGRELWKTDGTSAGTVRITDLSPGSGSGVVSVPMAVTPNTILFSGVNPQTLHGSVLWKSDGTAAGTLPVLTSDGGFVPNPAAGTTFGTAYFFQAIEPDTGRELWRMDANGVALFMDIWPGSSGSSPSAPLILGGKLYFQAQDPVNGVGWWTSDGTTAGTHRLPNINPNAGVNMEQMTVLGDRLYFTIDDGVHGIEPWYFQAPRTSTARDTSAGIANASPHAASLPITNVFVSSEQKQDADVLDVLLG
jgi:ELWxxDGT repeat protein